MHGLQKSFLTFITYSLLKRKSFEHRGMKDTVSTYVMRTQDNYEGIQVKKKKMLYLIVGQASAT